MSGSDSGIANRSIPSLVWIANPPLTPGSQATIVLLIGFCLLGPNSERVADIDAGDDAERQEDGHAHDDQGGVHWRRFDMMLLASVKRIFSAFGIPSFRMRLTCLGVASPSSRR